MRLFYYACCARTYYGGCLEDIDFKSYLKLKREDFSLHAKSSFNIFNSGSSGLDHRASLNVRERQTWNGCAD